MEVEKAAMAAEESIRMERMKFSRDMGELRLKKRTLETVLEECQRALELIDSKGFIRGGDDADEDDSDDGAGSSSASPYRDKETDEMCVLLKSTFEGPEFLGKLESAQACVSKSLAEDGNSWDVINEKDLWEDGKFELDQEDYVLVRQEDIIDGVACFMAAYLFSLKETKELSPNQLQEALCKTFSVRKKKGKLRKAWDGSKVIYNVASWGATAIGIYQNPAILKAASTAFWTSCHVMSKLF